MRSGMSPSLYLSRRGAIKQFVVIIGGYHFCQIRTNFFKLNAQYCSGDNGN